MKWNVCARALPLAAPPHRRDVAVDKIRGCCLVEGPVEEIHSDSNGLEPLRNTTALSVSADKEKSGYDGASSLHSVQTLPPFLLAILAKSLDAGRGNK